jgi:hypothetical protein
MNLPRFLSVLVLLFLFGEARADDFRALRTTLHKEPAYRSKPKYCLLVFGPEAQTRVWLVQDGDTLYVDRNGNGDLTEPGEKVATEKRDGADEASYSFNVGEITDGPRRHKNLQVYVAKLDHLASLDESVKKFLAQHPTARGYHISAEIDMPGWKGIGVGGRVGQRTFFFDNAGVLQFADRPQDAPIIHFGGPWHAFLFSRNELTVGRERDIVLGVGTPGIGPSTTTFIDYEGVIPENVYPTLEVTYPPKHPGEPPIHERYTLKRRC